MDDRQLPIDPLALKYSQQQGELCARSTWSWAHLLIPLLVFEVGLYCALSGPLVLMTAVTFFITFSLLLTVAFRLSVVGLAIAANPEVKVSEEQVRTTQAMSLPIYTILVPLFREANVAEGIVRALSRLNYPKDHLDIKLLLEGDDDLTIDAVRGIDLGPEFDVIEVPPGLPRTKPKACNYGLQAAQGEFLVIFDAEDRPEPDQLLKVVHAFGEASPDVVCIQAKLNYYNARENLLTRFFALEYTAWFDMVLPGIQYLNGPIPLGGTSNHFRTSVLREFGGWDPFNVTEDCDLGARLAVAGYRTLLIDSTTWEEANCHAGNWVRQRSRWVKGYLQTHLIHSKKLFGLVRSLGMRRTFLFYMTVGGVAAQQLLNLLCWPVTLVYLALLCIDLGSGRDPWIVMAGSRDEYRVAWKLLFWGAGESSVWSVVSVIGFVASVLMLLANLIFIFINLLACRCRNYSDLWGAAVLSPFYWLLGSVAAWKGAFQLLTRPHYWEKTIHGLTSTHAHADADVTQDSPSSPPKELTPR
jgi:cellulose synthase/poly-beta-1,6-N-acetylglucosamine synthase-like glycosyltransferase